MGEVSARKVIRYLRRKNPHSYVSPDGRCYIVVKHYDGERALSSAEFEALAQEAYELICKAPRGLGSPEEEALEGHGEEESNGKPKTDEM